MSYKDKYLKYKAKYTICKKIMQYGGHKQLGDAITIAGITDNIIIVFDKVSDSDGDAKNWTVLDDMLTYKIVDDSTFFEKNNETNLVGFYYEQQYYDDPYQMSQMEFKDKGIVKNIDEIVENIIKIAASQTSTESGSLRYIGDRKSDTVALSCGKVFSHIKLYIESDIKTPITRDSKSKLASVQIEMPDKEKQILYLSDDITKKLMQKLYGSRYEKLNRTQIVMLRNPNEQTAPDLQKTLEKFSVNTTKLTVNFINSDKYVFVENQAYVNFKESYVGYCTLNNSNLKGEMMTVFSNLYNLLNNDMFASNSELKNLNDEPVLLKIAMLYSQKVQINSIDQLISGDLNYYLLDHTKNPVNIYHICVAPKLSTANIHDCYKYALVAFYKAVFYMYFGKKNKRNETVHINTSNWKSLNINVSYVIQYLAAHNILSLFDEKNIAKINETPVDVKFGINGVTTSEPVKVNHINYNYYCSLADFEQLQNNAVKFLDNNKDKTTGDILGYIINNSKKCEPGRTTGVSIPLEGVSDDAGADLYDYWKINWM